MSDKEYALEIKNLHKHFKLPTEKASTIKGLLINRLRGIRGFKKQNVLRGIDFKVEKGEFFGVVGRNGSGKSTLLKIISEIYQPSRGKVRVNGRLVPFIELGVGFHPELTGRENVYLNGAMLGFGNKEIDAMYDDIVNFAELHEFMDQKLKNYSSGMQVRLAFSVAIQAQGDILVLDEVLAVGDEAFQRKCNDYFQKIRDDKNKTIILVTHNMNSVREYCDRGILIRDGEIAVDGSADEIADAYSKDLATARVGGVRTNRTGSAEITYNNIKHKVTTESLIIDFDITNNTDKTIDGINLIFDFWNGSVPITCSSIRYLPKYKKGLSLQGGESKHFEVTIPNIFGNIEVTTNLRIHTHNNITLCDSLKPAFVFHSGQYSYSDYINIVTPLTVREVK